MQTKYARSRAGPGHHGQRNTLLFAVPLLILAAAVLVARWQPAGHDAATTSSAGTKVDVPVSNGAAADPGVRPRGGMAEAIDQLPAHAAVPPTVATADQPPVTVYLVADADQAAYINQSINEADLIRATDGQQPLDAVVIVAAADDTLQTDITAQTGNRQFTVVDLRQK